MGEKVSDSTTIDAPAATVLAVINDLAAYPSWADGVKKVEVLETDDEGRPARAHFEVDAKVMQVTYTLDYTYTDTSVTWKLVEGDAMTQLDGGYELTPDGDKTGVRYGLEMDLNMPLPGFMKKRAAKQILDTGLKGLKKRAESR